MGRPFCGGTVKTLRDQYVLFTGKTFVDGVHERKSDLQRSIAARGGRTAPDRSKALTLLVWGDLSTQHVVDPIFERSQKVVFVDNERAAGNHICLIDSAGISLLLRDVPAPCLETNAIDFETIEITQRHASVEAAHAILGERVEPHPAPTHDAVGLSLDLTGLDRGTAAHEALVLTLREHLAETGITAREPAPGVPRFDVGWERSGGPATIYIAELKSLTGANEAQQIRLGLGQVLDYAFSIAVAKLADDSLVQPVLVLEREPSDHRWLALAESLHVVLTWPPGFHGL